MTARRTFHIYADQDAARELEAVGEAGGSKSRYVGELVKRRADDWREALRYLEHNGCLEGLDTAGMVRFVSRFRLVFGDTYHDVVKTLPVEVMPDDVLAWVVLAGEYRINHSCRLAVNAALVAAAAGEGGGDGSAE